MKLRTAKRSDLKAMTDIIGRTFSKADAREARAEILEIMSLKSSKQLFVVAEQDGELLGLAGMAQSWLDFHAYEVFWVAVRPDRQKGGIGAKIVADLLKRAKGFKGQNRADAVILSTDSPAFFAKCGFAAVDEFKRNGCTLMTVKF